MSRKTPNNTYCRCCTYKITTLNRSYICAFWSIFQKIIHTKAVTEFGSWTILCWKASRLKKHKFCDWNHNSKLIKSYLVQFLLFLIKEVKVRRTNKQKITYFVFSIVGNETACAVSSYKTHIKINDISENWNH